MVSCKADKLRLTLARFDIIIAMIDEDNDLREMLIGYFCEELKET